MAANVLMHLLTDSVFVWVSAHTGQDGFLPAVSLFKTGWIENEWKLIS